MFVLGWKAAAGIFDKFLTRFELALVTLGSGGFPGLRSDVESRSEYVLDCSGFRLLFA